MLIEFPSHRVSSQDSELLIFPVSRSRQQHSPVLSISKSVTKGLHPLALLLQLDLPC